MSGWAPTGLIQAVMRRRQRYAVKADAVQGAPHRVEHYLRARRKAGVDLLIELARRRQPRAEMLSRARKHVDRLKGEIKAAYAGGHSTGRLVRELRRRESTLHRLELERPPRKGMKS